ncbi:MAG: MarC family protein [Bacteroidia bacterium]|nr:MarC family protein [Bacteroidia bacterium]NNF30740.1 MarC family protein [Flavobacteriaceae bacterium]MBT8277215.1 MarC family protein [Bacteroidia bacterium]NNJ81683.1 MarC family protein [Flavobacteriaceae bacterium]NNK54815.1 MarC family protein [Flavobacteriaceae bacterium]
MTLNAKEIFTASMVLFAVIDIIGNIPIIISLREKAGHIHSEKASIIAAVVLTVFLFVGESILKLIGINVNEFAVAGAFVLFFIAIEMLLGITLFKDDGTGPEVATIFPLAFPMLAGPGSLTTILSLRAEYEIQNVIVAIIINIIVIYIVLKTSARLQRFLGKNGIGIIRKIFGVILLAIAVKLFTSNIQELFN